MRGWTWTCGSGAGRRRAHGCGATRSPALLRDRGAPVPASLPAYDVAVRTADEAQALAVRVEEGLALRWRDLVGGTDDAAVRRAAVSGLTECAVRAARWRRTLGQPP